MDFAASMPSAAIIAFAALAAALAAALLWTGRRLARVEARCAAREASLDHAGARVGELRAELKSARDEARLIAEAHDALARSHERLKAEGAALEGRLRDLHDAKEQMRQSFGETAGALLKQQSETFKSQNREQVEHLLTPLRTKIEEFSKSLGDAHLTTTEQHGVLKAQIESLSTRSAAMSKETENLTRALKGNVQIQGGWGEMIVDTILERLGLREGHEYTRQESHAHEGGGRSRTDYVINLPSGDRLIVDSKVSLTAFEAYAKAEDENARAAHLEAHVASIRAHVKALGRKEYHSKVGTPLDFVIMFVPIEAALGEALRRDDEILLFAADNKVAIATPATLTTQLKTVAAIWRVERQNRNAEEIANRAGALYDKFVGFVGDMQMIGSRMRQLDGSYQEALKKLSTGPGNLVRQTEMLKELGAPTNKKLPRDLLEGADLVSADAPPRLAPPVEGEEETSPTIQ